MGIASPAQCACRSSVATRLIPHYVKCKCAEGIAPRKPFRIDFPLDFARGCGSPGLRPAVLGVGCRSDIYGCVGPRHIARKVERDILSWQSERSTSEFFSGTDFPACHLLLSIAEKRAACISRGRLRRQAYGCRLSLAGHGRLGDKIRRFAALHTRAREMCAVRPFPLLISACGCG